MPLLAGLLAKDIKQQTTNIYLMPGQITFLSLLIIHNTSMKCVTHMGEEKGVYRVLVGKLEGKRPLGRPRHRWVDNIRMDLREVGYGYMD